MKKIIEIINKKDINIHIYLINKKGDQYNSFIFPNNMDDSIKNKYNNNCNDFIRDKKIDEYNNVLFEKGTIQKLPLSGIDTWSAMHDSIEIAKKNKTKLTKELFSDDYKYIIIKYEKNKDIVYFVSRYISGKSWFKNKVLFSFLGETFKENKEDLFVLNGNIDCVIYDNNVYIFNDNNFEKIFNYNENMKKIIYEHKNEINRYNFIDDPEKFYNLIINNKQTTRYFARVLHKDVYDFTILKPNHVKKVLSNFNEFSNLKFNRENKIIIDVKSRDLIISILRGKYLRSLFSEDIVETKGV